MSFYVLISFYSYTIPRFPQKDRYQWHKIKTAWWDATRRLDNTFRASVRTAFCALQSLSCGESLWVYDVTFRWGCKWVKERSRVLQNQISLAVSNQDKKKKMLQISKAVHWQGERICLEISQPHLTSLVGARIFYFIFFFIKEKVQSFWKSGLSRMWMRQKRVGEIRDQTAETTSLDNLLSKVTLLLSERCVKEKG